MMRLAIGNRRLRFCSVGDAIEHIVSMRSPTKILNQIIQRFPVLVESFHSFGARSDEGLQYKAMDFPAMRFSVFSKRNNPPHVARSYSLNPPAQDASIDLSASAFSGLHR